MAHEFQILNTRQNYLLCKYAKKHAIYRSLIFLITTTQQSNYAPNHYHR